MMKLWRGLCQWFSPEPAAPPAAEVSPPPAPAAAPVPQPSTPDIGAVSDVGRVRARNEDRFLVLQTLTGSNSATSLLLSLLVVADGMGGQANGDTASEIAVRAIAARALAGLPSLSDASPTNQPIQEVLTEAVRAAHEAILRHAASQRGSQAAAAEDGMGATATVALLVGSSVYLAHVGDTRAYALDAEGLHVLTRDHSLVGRLQELGQLTAEEAQRHPQRNVVYRALGQSEELPVETYHRRLAGVSHLLLCSDGLWGLVPPTEIARLVRAAPGAQAACEALVAAANAAGGEDNITAVLLALPPQPDDAPATA